MTIAYYSLILNSLMSQYNNNNILYTKRSGGIYTNNNKHINN